MSFVNEEGVRQLSELLISDIFSVAFDKLPLETPFASITYDQAMERVRPITPYHCHTILLL